MSMGHTWDLEDNRFHASFEGHLEHLQFDCHRSWNWETCLWKDAFDIEYLEGASYDPMNSTFQKGFYQTTHSLRPEK